MATSDIKNMGSMVEGGTAKPVYIANSDSDPLPVKVVQPDANKTTTVNTPSINGSGSALAANPNRKAWSIQNLGTNPLFVRLGAGASTLLFHVVLKAGGAQDDGSGGFLADQIYQGAVTVAGTSPRYTVTEMA